MRLFILRRGCAVSLLLAAVAGAAETEAPAAIEVGARAPAMQVTNIDGRDAVIGETFTSPTLMLFMKENDRYSSQTITALAEVFDHSPQLANGIERVAIFTRLRAGENAATLDRLKDDGWKIFFDQKDQGFHDYLIIATPTTVLVGTDAIVAAVHPGYDAGLADDVRKSIAKVTGVALPRGATAKAERPNMALQMGRRMAQRGLWDRAITYYEKAAAESPLNPEAQLEKAAILLELGRRDDAKALISELNGKVPDGALDTIRKRLNAQQPSEHKPPKINR